MTETALAQPVASQQARRRLALVLLIWIAAIALATTVDAPAAARVHAAKVGEVSLEHWIRHNPAIIAIKWTGTYWFTLIVAGVACFLHPLKWQAGGFMCLSGLPGIVELLVKWIVGRIRPFRVEGILQPLPFHFEPFRKGLSGLFTQENLAFPSGHATVVFAAAAAAAMLWPKWRWVFYIIATLVAIERVAENAHWVSDVVAGAALGILGVRAIAWYCARKFPSSTQTKTAASPLPH